MAIIAILLLVYRGDFAVLRTWLFIEGHVTLSIPSCHVDGSNGSAIGSAIDLSCVNPMHQIILDVPSIY